MKSKRQQAILELIKKEICLTQEDLQNGLSKAGFQVTQSTVSRDINELHLVKGRDRDGNYRYLVTERENDRSKDHYRDVFVKSVRNIVFSMNTVVIKCYNGMASGACVALDNLFADKMLGSLAGEDTIIVITAGEKQSEELVQELKTLT